MKYALIDGRKYVEFNPKAGTTKIGGIAGVDLSIYLLRAGVSFVRKINREYANNCSVSGAYITDLIDIDEQRMLWKVLVQAGFKQI